MIDDPGRIAVLGGIDMDNPELRARLNAITERTAARLGQPIGLVSMVLDSAQLFLGSHGLDGWLAEVGGSPVEWSFCADVVTSGSPYVVPDAENDARQRTNPLVTDEGVRSYAGAPIVVAGKVLGAHCVFGFEAHTFTEEDLAELRAGAEEIAVLLQTYPFPLSAAEPAE